MCKYIYLCYTWKEGQQFHCGEQRESRPASHGGCGHGSEHVHPWRKIETKIQDNLKDCKTQTQTVNCRLCQI